MKMQDTSLSQRGTMATELPVISTFRKRANKRISRGGTLFFQASRDSEDLLKDEEILNFVGHRLSSYLGVLTWVSTGEGSEPGNCLPSCLWHMLTLEERR